MTLRFLDRLSSGHIAKANLSLLKNIIEIYGVIKRDLCDLKPLSASAVDALVKMMKRCLEGRYSNMLLLLSNVLLLLNSQKHPPTVQNHPFSDERRF